LVGEVASCLLSSAYLVSPAQTDPPSAVAGFTGHTEGYDSVAQDWERERGRENERREREREKDEYINDDMKQS
jgi:hypothetical protein